MREGPLATFRLANNLAVDPPQWAESAQNRAVGSRRPVRFGPSTAGGLAVLVAGWAVRIAAALAGVLTIHYAVVRGRDLQKSAPEIFLGAAPFVGRNFRDGWDWRFSPAQIVAGALAVGLAVLVTRQWWWKAGPLPVTAVAGLGAGMFAAALAATDGRDGFTYGIAHETEYLANLPIAPPAGEFVDTFVERINDYSVHVRGHPPGYLLGLKALDALGLHGVWPVVVVTLLAVMVAAAATVGAVWLVAGDRWARRAAPLAAVAPGLVWMVSSADAVYCALGTVTVFLLAWSHRCTGPAAVVAGAGSGLAYGALLYGTYGGAVFALVPISVCVAGWRWRRSGLVPGTISAVGAVAAVTAAFTIAGFWWFEGLSTTRAEYWEGTAQFRTAWYFVAVNVAVALIVLGPAVVAGVLHARLDRLWALAGAGLACIVVSILSQYSKGEVERIWLLFFPWVGVLGARWIRPDHRVMAAVAVLAQAATAIVLQAALISKW